MNRLITLHGPHGTMHGQLHVPDLAQGLILVPQVHASPIENWIADSLLARGYATLTMNLLSSAESHFPDAAQNVPRLTQRLLDILQLIRNDGDMFALSLGILASGDVVPAATRTAAQRDAQVHALVCLGGLVDRAGLQALELLTAPLLMVFDPNDTIAPSAFNRAAKHLLGQYDQVSPAQISDAELLVRVHAWFRDHLPLPTEPPIER